MKATWLMAGMCLVAMGCSEPVDPALGKEVYEASCAGCHGVDGAGTASGKALADAATNWELSDIEEVVIDGVPSTAMPAFATTLSDEEITSVSAYIQDSFAE